MSRTVQITSREWRWAIGWAVAILGLSCIPYFIAGQLAPDGWQFAGFLVNPLDGHSYLAKMRQGYNGSWLFHLTYTPEPHSGAFIFTFYLALGHLAALTGLSLIGVFHLARLVSGFVLLATAFRLVALVTPHPPERRLAFGLLISASGLGWLGAILNTFPVDLWVPEAFVPYSIYANPHFPLGMALMLVIFQMVIWPEAQFSANTTVLTLVAGLAGLLLALVLPFALLTVWAVLAAVILTSYLSRRGLPWPQIWPTLGVVIFAAPVIAYDYRLSVAHPILSGWSRQNITPAPPVLDVLLGYGLVGVLAVVGGWIVIRQGLKSTPAERFILLWAVTTLVLVYLPLNLQRRLINGWHIPLCILAALGLSRWTGLTRLPPAYRRLARNVVVATGALGTLFVWSIPLLGMLTPPDQSETTARFFLRREEAIALNWLRENTRPGDVVLASPRLGMFVPGYTGARAFYGHPFETVNAKAKKTAVEAYYRGNTNNISPRPNFIIYGPSEQALGKPALPAQYPAVFAANGVTIYRVKE